MSSKVFEVKKIKVTNLSLWSQNPRFQPKHYDKPDSVLIDYLVSVANYDIRTLAREIVQEFELPQFEKLAVYEDNGKLVSLEGNRRLTAYKLLINPSLTSDADTRFYFEELKSKVSITDSFELECVVSNNFSQIIKYVDRKHLKNNNEKPWGQIERGHAKYILLDNTSKKVLLEKELFQIVNNLDIDESQKDAILGKGFVTSFFRIVGSTSAFDLLKLFFDDNKKLKSEDQYFLAKLKQIIFDVLNKKTFNGKIISRLDKDDIYTYLESIKIEIVKPEPTKTTTPANQTKQAEDIGQKNTVDNTPNTNQVELPDLGTTSIPVVKSSSQAQLPEPVSRPNAKEPSRNRLIPKKPVLNIPSNKINCIYRELRDDLLLNDSNKAVPNAVGVLFRVFLETSLDYYAENNKGHLFGQNITISQKINYVVSDLISTGKYKNSIFDNIRTVANSNKHQSYLSIEKFHQYVHSNTLQPSPGELKNKWDLLSNFFQILWGEVNEKDSLKKSKKK